MKVGLPQELTHIAWMPFMKERITGLVPGITWVHVSAKKNIRPTFLEGDVCFPFKTMIATSLGLLGETDVLFLPRLVSLDGFCMCPNFRGLPDLVTLNAKKMGLENTAAVASVVVDAADRPQFIKAAGAAAGEILKIARTGTSAPVSTQPDDRVDVSQACDSVRAAVAPGQRDLSRTIALIGHPYLLEDARLNNGVPALLRAAGFDVILCSELPFDSLSQLAREYDYYAKKLYFRSAREALGAFLYFSRVSRPAGIIHLIPFNCGVDALLRIEIESLHKKIKNAPPCLVIVCDEHTQHDHVVTRLEAFLDIVHETGR